MSELAELYRSNSYSHRVAAEVRAHAARQGIAQKDLAKALDYVPSQISKRMRGTIAFTLDELAVLAQMFEIEPAELLPRSPVVVDPELSEAEKVRRQGLEPRTRWLTLIPGGGGGTACDRRLPPFYPSVAPGVPLHPADPSPATRPIPRRPFRPVIVRFGNDHVA